MRRFLFFFNDTATTEIYTLSLHDALPIFAPPRCEECHNPGKLAWCQAGRTRIGARSVPSSLSASRDRKSTRLNSSHANISYAVFCLKKKNTSINLTQHWIHPRQYMLVLHI